MSEYKKAIEQTEKLVRRTLGIVQAERPNALRELQVAKDFGKSTLIQEQNLQTIYSDIQYWKAFLFEIKNLTIKECQAFVMNNS